MLLLVLITGCRPFELKIGPEDSAIPTDPISGLPNVDDDRDGFTDLDGDCDDTNPEIFPGAVEFWYDGVDQDCLGNSDYDQDGDGEDSWIALGGDEGPGTDCDDDNDNSFVDGCGGRDLGPEGDCDDGAATINPHMSENNNNNIDDNCNGAMQFTMSVEWANSTLRVSITDDEPYYLLLFGAMGTPNWDDRIPMDGLNYHQAGATTVVDVDVNCFDTDCTHLTPFSTDVYIYRTGATYGFASIPPGADYVRCVMWGPGAEDFDLSLTGLENCAIINDRLVTSGDANAYWDGQY